MGKITILKGKVLKGDVVEISYTKTDTVKNKPAKCNEEHQAPPHPDLTKALAKLIPHAILLGEFALPSKLKAIDDLDEATVSQFHVTGFSISDKSEEAVIITAQRTLSSGKTMGFNTPLAVFSDESETAYKFLKELEIAVAECRDEFEAYLGGKFKEDNQGKLDFDAKD